MTRERTLNKLLLSASRASQLAPAARACGDQADDADGQTRRADVTRVMAADMVYRHPGVADESYNGADLFAWHIRAVGAAGPRE